MSIRRAKYLKSYGRTRALGFTKGETKYGIRGGKGELSPDGIVKISLYVGARNGPAIRGISDERNPTIT